MEAKPIPFIKLLMDRCQYKIPIYQRTYNWGIEQWKQLWDDVINIPTDANSKGHFVGSIIYIHKGIYETSVIPELVVIDGQQRLTTVSILLHALSKHLNRDDQNGEITKEKIEEYYLYNSKEKGETRYKLVLSKADKDTLFFLFDGRDPPAEHSLKIQECHEFFENEIRNTKVTPQTIFSNISRLVTVYISLDREHDDPHKIFESMNYTGLPLAETDLIRNYILMDLDVTEQEDIYNNYWYPMENSFGHTDHQYLFDRFLRDFLTLKLKRIPKLGDTYAEFKKYMPEKKVEKETEVVKELYKFSKYFVNMTLDREPDPDVKKAFHDLNMLDVGVTYPFLLDAYDSYFCQKITKDDFLRVVENVESYLFRRSVCGIPTNSLNKTFAGLEKEIDKDHYLESLKVALQQKEDYRRFPNDEEFKEALIIKDIYNSRLCKYWLNRLENHDRKEPIHAYNYTTEHILPKGENLPEEWKVELGENWKEIRKKWVHTIGNLTLTGYNSELSNFAFAAKRDMKGGFGDSPLRLNKDLASLEHWNEEEIIKRAKKLSTIAIQIWPYPEISKEVADKYKKEEKSKAEKNYTLDDHKYLKGPSGNLFENLRRSIMDLGPSVRQEILKLYIAFKVTTNFVDVIPQKNQLILHLNMKFSEIRDPKAICIDISNKGKWGNGEIEVQFDSLTQLDDVMDLIRQSFDKQIEE